MNDRKRRYNRNTSPRQRHRENRQMNSDSISHCMRRVCVCVFSVSPKTWKSTQKARFHTLLPTVSLSPVTVVEAPHIANHFQNQIEKGERKRTRSITIVVHMHHQHERTRSIRAGGNCDILYDSLIRNESYESPAALISDNYSLPDFTNH